MTQPAPNPPPQQAPTLPMVDQAGNLVPVPHDQVAQAFASGKYGFQRGQDVPVVGSDGTVGHVAPEHAAAVLQGGGKIASPEEIQKAELDAKYGGIGHAVIAAAEGGARGISLGISDPLAAFAGKVIGGDKGEQAVREHLLSEKEEHPWAATGGELLGAAAPILATGGAAAPEEAAALGARGGAAALGEANEAGVIASIGKGVRTLGALPRSVSYLGDAAEHAVSGLLGASDTMIGSAARAAAKAATRGIVEGGLFGAGQEVSESSLDNQPLTAEKLFASIGHGALMGGLLGAGLSGAGELAGDVAGHVLGKVAPTLEEAAGEQAWKWLDPLKKFSDQATKRAGGTDAVGRTVFEEVLRPLVEEKGLTAAALSNDEKYELVQKALDDKGKQIGDLIAGNSHATVKLEDMLRPIQERIDEYAGKVGGEDKAATLEKLKASVRRVLGGEQAEPIEARLKGLIPGSPEHEASLTQAGYVKRSPVELGEHIRANPDLLKSPGPLPLEATHIAPAPNPNAGLVSIADAIQQRRSLQQIAFEESKSLDPNLRVQLLRDVSGEWNALEERALNAASKDEEGLAGSQLRDLNKTYQRLKIAGDALETNTARYATNRNLSLTDYLAGAAHAPGMLLAGHPVAAASALGMSVAHKALRAHGNAYAALMLDRLATFGGASKAVSEFDSEMNRAIEASLSGKTRKLPRVFHKSSDHNASFDEEESRVRRLAAVSPGLVGAHLQDRTAPLATHMPQTAAAMQTTAKGVNGWLASKLPPSPLGQQPSLTPQLDKAKASEADKAKLMRAVAAANGGPVDIMKRFAAGKVTPEDIEYLRKFAPQTLNEVRAKVASQCAERKTPVSYQQQLRYSQLFNEPMSPTLQPQFRMAIQESYKAHPTAPTGQPAPSRSAPSSLGISKSIESQFERAQSGER
jgi:hypothetical protein